MQMSLFRFQNCYVCNHSNAHIKITFTSVSSIIKGLLRRQDVSKKGGYEMTDLSVSLIP